MDIDVSAASDKDIMDQMAGAQIYLKALRDGAPLGPGREDAKIAEVERFIGKCQAELDKRHADRT
jgi:hypothetical protein